MKLALVNPNWTFTDSIYFGCREPHLPLEFGYARALLEAAGHEARIIDAQIENLTHAQVRARVEAFHPDIAVVTTAPTYLFWRCAQPELRVPQALARELRGAADLLVAVGPHSSSSPRSTLDKLEVQAVVLGECEEVLVHLADTSPDRWKEVESIAYRFEGAVHVQGEPASVDVTRLPALQWPEEMIRRHRHHHHRFDAVPSGAGAEIEASRGCPYRCTFCAKENFRDRYRRRPLEVVLEELDNLIGQGVEYVYFVDEIFLPDRALLEALARRPVRFGIQTRIDLFSEDAIDLLSRAGCVSIEAGVESISERGRRRLSKHCLLDTGEISARLVRARRGVPFVQANLIVSDADDRREVEGWRQRMQASGVWVSEPVPLFPYPGSPRYRSLWGAPDDRAWERALDHYLALFESFSDIQEERPRPLHELEAVSRAARA